MQSADSRNQFNFCCSVTRRGRGRKVRAILKAAVQLRKQNIPSKEFSKIQSFLGRKGGSGLKCGLSSEEKGMGRGEVLGEAWKTQCPEEPRALSAKLTDQDGIALCPSVLESSESQGR